MNRYRVMIVDDDPDIRFVLKNLLSMNFETVGAENGLDALEKVERYEPDLMLLDVNMPVMNGFRCCQGVRRHPQYHDLPVFFLSGYGDRANYAEAYASGATVYLEKPLDVRQLIRMIEEHFAKRGGTVAAKTFSLEELEKVDRTPLHPATETIGGGDEDTQPPAATQREESVPPTLLSEQQTAVEKHAKQRRVFGRGAAQKPQEAPRKPDTIREIVPEADSEPAAQAVAPPCVSTPLEDKPSREPSHPQPPEPPDKPSGIPPEPIELTPRYGRVLQPRPIAGPGRLQSVPDRQQPAGQRKEQPKPTPLAPAGPPVEPKPAEAAVRLKPPPPPPPPPSPPAPPAPPQENKPPIPPRVMVVNHDSKELVPLAEGVRGLGEFMPLEETGEAIEHIARFQPDMVICPIGMKDWDGLQVFDMLRGNARLSHIQVVFLADPREDPVRRAAAERRCGHPLLTRPLQPARIREVLEQVIRQPGFVVRQKRATYGEFVRDVLKKIEKEKENRRRLKEQEAHMQHLSGWAQFLSTELKEFKPPPAPESGSLRTYYLP
jgi:CheY-like chemotaxis protein